MTPKQIAALRARLGVTMQELADRVADTNVTMRVGDLRYISRQRVYAWETGRREPCDVEVIALRRLERKHRDRKE